MEDMVALTTEMKAVFEKNRDRFVAFPMATASKAGVPNVAPMASIWLQDDETIWICDNYMVKTLENLRENPLVAIYMWDPDTKRCFQVKGDARILTSGDDYARMVRMVREAKPQFPAKSLIVLKITEVYECTPGKMAGEKVL
jgi:predicted pyridoxine 5'-phosphate oxidase superfamily flavin-nucleotide-binding protein